MPPFRSPTRRELAVGAVLVVIALLFTQAEHLSSASQTALGAGQGAWNSLKEVFRRPSTERIYDPTRHYPLRRVEWTDSPPETTLLRHAPGWTIYDRVYFIDGTMFIVTSNPDEFPPREMVLSNGRPFYNGEEEMRSRLPGDADMQILTPEEAQRRFNVTSAAPMAGTSFIITDNQQFLTHYFHFAAELFLGLWRTYTSLDPDMQADGHTTLPAPTRIMFSHVSCQHWRDYANLNEYVVRAAFPSAMMEFDENWIDRGTLGALFVFERVVLADRSAATKGPTNGHTFRTASEAFTLPGSEHFWTPIREHVLQFVGVAPEWVRGPDPGTLAERQQYVITYVSRQEWGRRMVRPADHDKLVAELYHLRDKYGYEVNVVSLDKVSRTEQFQIAGRSTVMMGVHGNGLTALLWMRPSPRTTVIEFFIPKGIAFDYQWTSNALGIKHYGVWNDKFFTQPNVPKHQAFPEGFHGNEIPVDGAAVAQLAHRRLTLTPDNEDDLVTSFD